MNVYIINLGFIFHHHWIVTKINIYFYIMNCFPIWVHCHTILPCDVVIFCLFYLLWFQLMTWFVVWIKHFWKIILYNCTEDGITILLRCLLTDCIYALASWYDCKMWYNLCDVFWDLIICLKVIVVCVFV